MATIDPASDPRFAAGLEAIAKRLEKEASKGMSYYAERHATWVKEILDRLHKDGIPLKVSAENGTKISSVKLRYYQGRRYLLEHGDQDGKYKALADATRCSTYRDYLEFHIKHEPVIKISTTGDWRTPVIAFLENAQPGDKFGPRNYGLSPEDIVWLLGNLKLLESTILYDESEIAAGNVFLIRIAPEPQAAN